MNKEISLIALGLCSLPGLLSAALTVNPITNGDFEADLGSTVGSGVGNFDNTASGWFGENGTVKGDFIQWDDSNINVPTDPNGEVWGGVAINENDSNNPGAYYQTIGTNEDNFEVLVSMTVGDRSNFFFQDIVVSLYSGNVIGANGSSLSGLGATLLDSATITNSVFAGDTTDGNTHTATISGLALNTGTTGVAGQSLWLEISSSVPGSEVWKYQALIDDVSVIPESSAYGLIAGCLAMTSIMLRRRRS
jgi:hypothetical protein